MYIKVMDKTMTTEDECTTIKNVNVYPSNAH